MKKRSVFVLVVVVVSVITWVSLSERHSGECVHHNKPEGAKQSQVGHTAAVRKPPAFMLSTNELHFVGQVSATFRGLEIGKKQETNTGLKTP